MQLIKEILWLTLIMGIGAVLMYHFGPEKVHQLFYYYRFDGCYAA